MEELFPLRSKFVSPVVIPQPWESWTRSDPGVSNRSESSCDAASCWTETGQNVIFHNSQISPFIPDKHETEPSQPQTGKGVWRRRAFKFDAVRASLDVFTQSQTN